MLEVDVLIKVKNIPLKYVPVAFSVEKGFRYFTLQT